MSHADPRIIVRQDAADLSGWLATEQGFLHAFARYNDERVEWERFQLALLGCKSRFRALEKSRQVGGSMVMAAEAVARATLRHNYCCTFLSLNREEAEDKIEYARQFHEALPMAYQKKLIRGTQQVLEFEERGGNRRRSRIMSHPSKPVRGKRGDVVMDELAHYAKDMAVYKGSTAPIARVPSAQITVLSSPLGMRGIFHAICRPTGNKFKRYVRLSVPWWICRAYSVDINISAVSAPHLPTAERVEKFGTEALKEQFDSLPLEDFQEEFECMFGSDKASYFGTDLVNNVTDSELGYADDADDLATFLIGGRCVAGFDVGRSGHPSELVVVEDDSGQDIVRLMMPFRNWEFDRQEAYLAKLLRRYKVIRRLSIDKTGIGMNLAENLERRFPERAEGCSFTNTSKASWCAGLKVRMQRNELCIPAERELKAQIRSIRKVHLQSGAVQFNSGRSRRSHADRFWALVLACKTEQRKTRPKPRAAEALIIG